MSRRTNRRLCLALLAAVLLPACTRAADSADAGGKTGSAAPDFTLRDQAGQEHSLASYRGRVVVLEWINPNCPFSRRHAEEGTMTRLASASADAVWLAVNSTAQGHKDSLSPAQHAAYNAKHGIAYPVLYDPDGKVGRAYDARTTPHMVVIDEAGKIVYDGAIDDDPYGRKDERVNYVEGALAAHQAGRAPDPGVTQPYGCSVKYQ
jgi:peroxiredoxin